MFFVCSLRTNIILVFIFALLTTTFALLAAAYWVLAEGLTALGARIEIVCYTIPLLLQFSSAICY